MEPNKLQQDKILMLDINFRRDLLPNYLSYVKQIPEAVEPTRQTKASAGLDLYTPDLNNVKWIIKPGADCLIDTGIILKMPSDTSSFVGIIKDKSSVALKGLCVKAGVIDSDFRGSIKVLLKNESQNCIELRGKEKIAQILFPMTWCPQSLISTDTCETMTERGTREFGGCNLKPNQPIIDV